MTDLSALYDRLAALTALDRDVADDVLRAWGYTSRKGGIADYETIWRRPDGRIIPAGKRPDPTVSVDAAAALMPEGAAINTFVYADGRTRVRGYWSGGGFDWVEAFNEATARTMAAVAAKMEDGE